MAITRVQGNTRGISTGSSIPVTLASTPTNGNVLIATIGVMSSYGVPSVSSISQTGVTWTKQVGKSDPTSYTDTEIWLGVVGSGASTAITINLSVTANYGTVADVCEYSGIQTSNFLDKTAVNKGSSASPDTGTTDTTTQADELWIGSTCLAMSAQTTPKNGFTLLDGAYYTYISEAFLEKIVSSTGQANSGTTGGGSSYWVGCIATFFAAAGVTTKSFSDSGGGSDAFINSYRAMGFSESGHGVESFVNPFRAMGISDVGHGAEAFNTPFRAMGFSDIGLGSDLFVVLLSKAFTDAGLGSDVFTKELIGFLEKAFADSGVGTDAFNIPFKALLFVDAGQGVDSFNIPFKAIMFSDTGQGVDVFVIPFKTMNFSDVANGVDVFALLRELTFSDVGGGIDSFAKTVLEIISKAFADAGMGSDVFLAKHIHKLKLPFLIGMTLDGQLVWIFKQEYDVE